MSTYYEILGIPEALQKEPHLPVQTLRSAYRLALLRNHPDKSSKTSSTKNDRYSIDEITQAFSILADPKLRIAYDTEVKLRRPYINANGPKDEGVFHTGIETVDLDDLETDEAQGIWFRDCRCGDKRGFLVEESDLEEAADDGEISVGCRGCSLWLKVLFGVMEDTPDPNAGG